MDNMTQQITNHKLILGDCLEELKKIPDESIDLIFADPPYGLAKKNGLGWKYSKHITLQEAWDIFSKDELLEFNIKWVTECMRLLKHGGSIWVSGSFHNIYQLGFILQHLDAKINNSIVWFKPNAQPNITCRMFTESTEHLIWGIKNHSKTKWVFNYKDTKNLIYDSINPKGKQTRNVWSIPLTSRKEKWAGEHPTQKPIELLRRVILSSTNKGDLVLDPFVGSGTTSVVAKMLKRNSIGIEKEKKYLDMAKKRLSQSVLN
ncbi:site-specific DNA-methyltransferase [Candidatus Woesearchaeota archaeon]|nr:site-specific DNA-methyltransferase [Candidatus Woesearchaeota archaeon]